MQLTPQEQQQLEDYQQMMGTEAGRLALALDNLTDVVTLLGQHKVYCRVEKGPREGQPPLDLVQTLQILDKAKSLVKESLQHLRDQP